MGIHVNGSYAYVADGSAGVYILEFTPTGLEGQQDPHLPVDFSLSQNCPNPFNISTRISYSLPVASWVRLEVFNLIGQRLAAPVDGQQSPGIKEIHWNAADMSSGIYFYRLTAGEFSNVRKMTLLK